MASAYPDEHAKVQYGSSDIARLRNGDTLPARLWKGDAVLGHRMSMKATNRLLRQDRARMRFRVSVSVVLLVAICYLSLGIMGAMGQDYAYAHAYAVYTPIEVAKVIYAHLYNAFAQVTHAWDPYTNDWLRDNVSGYWAVWNRAGVVGITLLCGILLSVSGMLYQNVFKNPLAGPSMLGASNGVSLGMMVLVVIFGASATNMLTERYVYCYGFGVAILLFVILAGKKLSGRGKPFDIVTMLLIGSIVGQLAGFIEQYVVLFLFAEDTTVQETYIELTQMLTIDTSALSWICLLVAFAVSFIPIYLMRFKMNALAFEEEEVRLFGLNFTRLRAVALVCGAIMLLAAQIHTGMVGMVSLIVPFVSRSWFGTEFSKQLTGNVCIGTLLLIICRDITDLIPFVGDGIGIGVIVQIVAMPIFVILMAKHLNEWE